MSNPRAVTALLGESPYVVTLSDGDHEWLADEPLESGGANRGPTPHQLVLSGLGACTAITLRGDLTAQQRERLLQDADACPVARTLSGELHTTTLLG